MTTETNRVHRLVALRVDMARATWRYTFWNCAAYALMPVLVPVLCILSRIRRKPIDFGVVVHQCDHPGGG